MDYSYRSSSSTEVSSDVLLGLEAVAHLFRDSGDLPFATRYLLSGEDGCLFLLWIAPTAERCRLTTQQAADWASKLLSQKNGVAGPLSCTFRDDEVKLGKHDQTGRLAVLSNVTEHDLNTMHFSAEEEDIIRSRAAATQAFGEPFSAHIGSLFRRQTHTGIQRYHLVGTASNSKSPWSPLARMLKWVAIAASVLLILLFTAVKIHDHISGRSDIWVRYNVHGSKGPRYQLQFNRHNVTEWATESDRVRFTDVKQWAFRIDDQAMVPADLYTPEEDRYQKWFQQRYPEKNEVRVKQLYLNQSFLSDPYAIQVPSDETFHTAHCVLALRRYWWAKESGRHVCPRDIDYRHMKHCLDSLDELAFPGGLRGPVEHPPEPNDTVLIWKTKVCF